MFNIREGMQDGKVVKNEAIFTPGVVSYPQAFKALVDPRSDAHEVLVRGITVSHEWQDSNADDLTQMRS